MLKIHVKYIEDKDWNFFSSDNDKSVYIVSCQGYPTKKYSAGMCEYGTHDATMYYLKDIGLVEIIEEIEPETYTNTIGEYLRDKEGK